MLKLYIQSKRHLILQFRRVEDAAVGEVAAAKAAGQPVASKEPKAGVAALAAKDAKAGKAWTAAMAGVAGTAALAVEAKAVPAGAACQGSASATVAPAWMTAVAGRAVVLRRSGRGVNAVAGHFSLWSSLMRLRSRNEYDAFPSKMMKKCVQI